MAFGATAHTSGVAALADLLNKARAAGYTPDSAIGPADLIFSILANALDNYPAGAGTVSAPSISTTGDSNTGIYFSAADKVDIAAGGVRSVQFAGASSAVNYLVFTPAAASSEPILSAAGSDTDIDITLTPKGAGVVTSAAGYRSTGTAAAGAIGYGTGAGGTVTQASNRTTGVTLSKLVGQITTNNASLAAEATADFTVTNTLVAAVDIIATSHTSSNGGGTIVQCAGVSAGSFVLRVHNGNVASGTAETAAIVINFAVIKGASA